MGPFLVDSMRWAGSRHQTYQVAGATPQRCGRWPSGIKQCGISKLGIRSIWQRQMGDHFGDRLVPILIHDLTSWSFEISDVDAYRYVRAMMAKWLLESSSNLNELGVDHDHRKKCTVLVSKVNQSWTLSDKRISGWLGEPARRGNVWIYIPKVIFSSDRQNSAWVRIWKIDSRCQCTSEYIYIYVYTYICNSCGTPDR